MVKISLQDFGINISICELTVLDTERNENKDEIKKTEGQRFLFD